MSQDTLELRDGTTVLGDVMSMSLTAVVVRVEGKDQKYDRNQIKKDYSGRARHHRASPYHAAEPH